MKVQDCMLNRTWNVCINTVCKLPRVWCSTQVTTYNEPCLNLESHRDSGRRQSPEQ
jgi:hypothetical protein